MKRILSCLLFVLCVSSMACATGGTLIKPDPLLTEQQRVRVSSERILDDVNGGLDIAQELSVGLDRMSLSTATKDDVDCALLKVLGTTTPVSAPTTKACGEIPPRDKAPFHVAIEELKAVTNCASLRTTVATVLKWMDPLIAKLNTSKNSTLAIAATGLQATFKFSRTLLGGQGCSA